MKPKIILSIITLSLLISACNPPAEAENTKNENDSDSKRELLEAERELLEQEKNLLEQEKINLEDKKIAIEEEAKLKENNRAIQRLEQSFLYVTDVYVKVNKTYFHSQPDPSTKLKSYLVTGDVGTLNNTRNGFGYIQFYNSNNGKSTNGWIRLTDLEEYTYY